MDLVVARCAGLDVSKNEVVACVRVPDGSGGRRQEVRTFSAFRFGLEALADWLSEESVTETLAAEDSSETIKPPGRRLRQTTPWSDEPL